MANPSRKELLMFAAYDFYFLLTRKYPRTKSLELVGNRYNLTKEEREILKRGIYGQRDALMRKGKQFKTTSWAEKTITIDGHNVHITLESILFGKTIVIANDGPIRDISGVSGSFRHTKMTMYVTDLLCNFFEKYPPARLAIFFDAPISKSGELARMYKKSLSRLPISIESAAVAVPEKIFDYKSTIIASSDSHVIDLSRNWLDIPRLIVDQFEIEVEWYDFSHLVFSPIITGHKNDR